MKAVRRSRTSFYSMSVLNFLLKNLQGCCLLFNYQGSFLLSSQRQLIYIITFTIACQQLFYFVLLRFRSSSLSPVCDSLLIIPNRHSFVNNFFQVFTILFCRHDLCFLFPYKLCYNQIRNFAPSFNGRMEISMKITNEKQQY